MATRKKSGAKNKFDASSIVRGIARERVGPVKSSRVIVPKSDRKPKHKRDSVAESEP